MIKRNVWLQTLLIAVVLTGVSYGVGFGFGWIDSINYLEPFAVLTSYASTYLCVVQKRFNYVFGAISSAAYFYLFFQSGLVASMVLNAALAIWLVYGWFRWRSDANTRPVTHLNWKWSPVYVVGALAFYGVVFLAVSYFGGTLALIDSVILVATVIAQILLDNKKVENWFVWIVVNVAAIYVYFSSGLFLVGFQYIFFLINTIIGYIAWRKSMKSEVDAVGKTPVVTEKLDIFDEFGFTDQNATDTRGIGSRIR